MSDETKFGQHKIHRQRAHKRASDIDTMDEVYNEAGSVPSRMVSEAKMLPHIPAMRSLLVKHEAMDLAEMLGLSPLLEGDQ